MSFNQYKRVFGAGTSYLSATDLFAEIDTTLGVATIYLPKISELFALFATNNFYNFNGIRFTDLANNAAVNNIILKGKDGDLVNGLSQITLNTNGVGGILTPISETGWSLTINNIASGGGVSNAVILLGAGIGSSFRCGNNNLANGSYSTVSGGCGNTSSGHYSTISGGILNTTSGLASKIGGGAINTTSGDASVIGGGYCNTASCSFSTVSGGYCNISSGIGSTVSGGGSNTGKSPIFNTASGEISTVSGGGANMASACA